MAATNFTPISLYYSTTAAAVPLAANLVAGELALNTVDGKLYYKSSAGVVTLLAGAGGSGIVAGSNTQIQFNNNGVFGASSNLTWSGTALAVTGALSATGTTTLSAATTPLLLSGAGSSSTTLATNYAIRINAAATAANYGGIFFDGSTAYDSFFGRVPTALSGINDGVGYVTYALGAPTLRTLFSSTGLAVTGTMSSSGNATVGSTGGTVTLTIGNTAVTGAGLINLTTSSAFNNWQIASNQYIQGLSFTPSTAAGGTTYTTPTLNILNTGNVGIMTSSPISRLDVRAASDVIGNYQTIQAISTDSAAIDLGGGIGLGGFYSGTSLTAVFGNIVGRKENGTGGNYAGYLAFGTNAQATGIVERARFNSTGALVFAGGTTTANGIGITFPATQSASSDANTLDDYEEGSWTPIIERASVNPTVTYSFQTGTYVKVGRIVTLTAGMGWSANSGGSGLFTLSGLPFVNSGSTSNYTQAHCIDYTGITFSAGATSLGGYVVINTTYVIFTSGGSAVTSAGPTLGSSGYVYMTVTYIASA